MARVSTGRVAVAMALPALHLPIGPGQPPPPEQDPEPTDNFFDDIEDARLRAEDLVDDATAVFGRAPGILRKNSDSIYYSFLTADQQRRVGKYAIGWQRRDMVGLMSQFNSKQIYNYVKWLNESADKLIKQLVTETDPLAIEKANLRIQSYALLDQLAFAMAEEHDACAAHVAAKGSQERARKAVTDALSEREQLLVRVMSDTNALSTRLLPSSDPLSAEDEVQRVVDARKQQLDAIAKARFEYDKHRGLAGFPFKKDVVQAAEDAQVVADHAGQVAHDLHEGARARVRKAVDALAGPQYRSEDWGWERFNGCKM